MKTPLRLDSLMATLVLGTVGSAVGGALLPGGLSLFGATITGAALGGAVGSLGGWRHRSGAARPARGPVRAKRRS